MTALESIHQLRTLNNAVSAALDDLTRQIKKDTNDQGNRPKITLIQNCVANFYDVSVQIMTIKARPAKWVLPRQVAMYLCRTHTPYSLEEIGHCFGDRDHGTVAFAVQQVQNRHSTDQKFAERLNAVSDIVGEQLKKEAMPLFSDQD